MEKKHDIRHASTTSRIPSRMAGREVRIAANSSDAQSSESSSRKEPNFLTNLKLSEKVTWISDNWTWSRLKPVIRCALAAWVAAVLFIIPEVEIWMGQASFIIIIASVLSPPSDPFIAVLEREFLILLFVTITWAWTCLGIKFADLTRKNTNHTVSLTEAADGQFVEAAPSIILGVFIGVGSAVILYVKGSQGPGPYLSACVLACICLDISLTTAALFPFPFYAIGKAIVLPLVFHSALALLASLTIFPFTISAQFTTRLETVLSPLSTVIDLHRTLLKSAPTTSNFSDLVHTIEGTVKKSERGLVAVAASGRLLENDLIFCRFAPEDFRAFQGFARRLVGRAHGLGLYFTLIDPTREKFPSTSIPNTPAAGTPNVLSRQPSLERTPREQDPGEGDRDTLDSRPDPPSPVGTPTHSVLSFSPTHSRSGSAANIHGQHRAHHHHHHHFSHLLQSSLLNVSLRPRRRKSEHAVGVFESQRYLNLEAKRLYDPNSEEYTRTTTELLQESCDELLEKAGEGVAAVRDWLGIVRRGRVDILLGRDGERRRRQDDVQKITQLRDALSAALRVFREESRLKVLEPYRSAIESKDDDEPHHGETPPHRHLFHCYVYQYHLIQLAGVILEMLDEIIKLEKERTKCRLWTPVKHWFSWNRLEIPENVEHAEDEDPDIIRGVHPMQEDDLGLPRSRDPDALPPRNWAERAMNTIYLTANSLWGGNTVFAIKAGAFSVVLALPYLLKESASFAYQNRYAWAMFMGQLSLCRFRGDTTFSLIARIIATFFGGLVGMVMWYISCGSGAGNAYGLAAVCAVCFPFLFFVALYCPIPPMTNIVGAITAILVIGYSYQDLNIPMPGSPGFGWSVAWRRFVLVIIGVVAAFLVSLLPPSMTLRAYQRHLLSTTCTELGAIYCSIISFATFKKEKNIQEIISNLIATRSKLNRSAGLRTNITYEFSMRGRWPAKRYQNILDLQLTISYSLSHLMSVMEHLEPSWTRAFLRRARFLDPDFQGDVLAVLSMTSSSLRTGNPLPQITPCPLLDRFMMRYHGLDVIHRESEEDYGLPRLLTMETLQNEQYMMFCVGISTAFGIINRLDRLMLATKEIVGEQYHIHGIGIPRLGLAGYELLRPGTNQFQPPKDA